MNTTVPQVTFKTRVRDSSVAGPNPFRWQDVSSHQLFAAKKIIIFALPGAFTPTCSNSHLPGFEASYQAFKELGVDEIYCLSVNDAFTMFKWSKDLDIHQVKMLPDGNGDFSRLMGMLVKKENLGFGERSWRYSMLVEDSVISALFSEAGKMDNCPDDPFSCSDAETLLAHMRSS
ncbi:peroxiredoxin [Cycloclasticus sp. 46_83_sub15_T18]|nr:peroxiredoxin [Cycloclasticus sp. 46_83_sub15_T18]